MTENDLIQPFKVLQDFHSGRLAGEAIGELRRSLGDLRGVFRDLHAYARMDSATLVYSVQFYRPAGEGLEGGLWWGSTVVEAGVVGDEYFLTRGHFHAIRNRAEYYITVRGSGALILMSEDGRTRAEEMQQGSVHYIPGATAHRAANTGETPLCFLACWPSDAGHDYDSIAKHGFGGRMRKIDGKPRLVAD